MKTRVILYHSFSTGKIWIVRNTKWTTAQFKLTNGSPYLKRWVYIKLFLMIHKALELKLYYLWSSLIRHKTSLKSCICFSYVCLSEPNISLTFYCCVLNYFPRNWRLDILIWTINFLTLPLHNGLCSTSPTTGCHQDFQNSLLSLFLL